MRRRTRTSIAGFGAGTLLAISGCGGGNLDGANVWILTGGIWDRVGEDIENYNEQAEDGQQLTIETFENESYKERIRTSIGSGEAPTLIMSWSGGPLAEYVDQDQVIDLSGEVDALQARVHDSVWDNGVIDGGVYGVPVTDVAPGVLYYNEALFEQVGLDVPETWSEVEQAIEVFNDHDITPFSMAGGSVWPALIWLQYLTDRHGGEEVFQAVVDGEPDAWSQESILYALEIMQELTEKGAFDETFMGVTADQNEDARLLADGEAAMLVQGSWVFLTMHDDYPDFAESGDFGWTTFPALEEGAGDPSNVVGNPTQFFSVSADATEEEQQIALDYLNSWVYNDEMVQTMLETQSVPPLTDIDDHMDGMEDPDYLEFIDTLVDEANHFQLSWDQAVMPNEEQPLIENLENLLHGNITPQEFVENMNALRE